MGLEVGRRQLQIGFGFRAFTLDGRARIACDLEHGRVLRQRMNKHHAHILAACMQHGTVKQTRAQPLAASSLEDGDTELGAFFVLRVTGKRQMGHGDQLEAAVEDTEDIVTLEVQLLHIARHLFVVGRIAKTQIAIPRIQLEQVLGNAVTVARAQRANRHQGRRATLGAMGLTHVAQPA